MKDFDFDELDRAVNSVLAKKEPSDRSETDSNTDTVHVTSDASVPVTVDDNNATHDDNSDSSTISDAEDTSSAVSVSVNNTSESSDDATEPALETHEDVDVQDVSSGESSDDSSEATTDSEPQTYGTNDDPTAESHVDETEQSDASNDQPSSSDEPSTPQLVEESAATSLASIPVKRGRFMDVMTPQNGDAKKPLAPRGGVKLTPSSDFSSSMAPDVVASDETAQDNNEAPVDLVDSTEPTPEISNDMSSHESDEPNTENDTTVTNTDDAAGAAEQGLIEQSGTTPFIPDVPVEKRPLNSLSPDTPSPLEQPHEESQPESTEPVSDQVSVDPTLTANVPKEFDKDIMAVEANETVGESDETHAQVTENSESPTPQTTDTTNSLAMAATTAEPHPMFDTSTLGHEGPATHHSSKITWTVVVASLFIVGAALGVLYFLYGQA